MYSQVLHIIAGTRWPRLGPTMLPMLSLLHSHAGHSTPQGSRYDALLPLPQALQRATFEGVAKEHPPCACHQFHGSWKDGVSEGVWTAGVSQGVGGEDHKEDRPQRQASTRQCMRQEAKK
jgi:hypothetical protein